MEDFSILKDLAEEDLGDLFAVYLPEDWWQERVVKATMPDYVSSLHKVYHKTDFVGVVFLVQYQGKKESYTTAYKTFRQAFLAFSADILRKEKDS